MSLKSSIRKKGVIQIAAGVIGYGLVFHFVLHEGLNPAPTTWKAVGQMTVVALPGVLSLVGVLHLVTGKQFSEFETYWMSLRGWHRGVFGVGVVLISLSAVVSLLIAAAYIGVI